jgi:hypothetical protein
VRQIPLLGKRDLLHMAKETYYIWQKRPTAPDTPIFIHTDTAFAAALVAR